uniref:Uncharacterized protein n=1 Tax=Rhizophora mucronata TaxID=61149 RepID=A0A2P2PAR3_RHIMU
MSVLDGTYLRLVTGVIELVLFALCVFA